MDTHGSNFQIVRRTENVERGTWFQMASDGVRETRQAADPCNIRPEIARLEVRRNFFSQRVVSDWNRIPPEIKCQTVWKVSRKVMRKSETGWSILRTRKEKGQDR